MSRIRAAGGAALVLGSRIGAVAALVILLGLLPWLSGQGAEYTILRARYADLEVTPENLAMVRGELGLDRGPVVIFLDWLSGLLRGDAGDSWITGTPVLPGVSAALGVSLTLMSFALVVALVVASLVAAPALIGGIRGVPRRGAGVVGAMLTALPEFVLAALLLLVGSVWLGIFPPYGWRGPVNAVLPALALGVPAGGLIGKLVADAIADASAERWVTTWTLAGLSWTRLALGIGRRALPSVLGQLGLVLVGLTGGAVAVEEIVAIPGLGRLTLGAASSQDLPTLQAGVLALVLLAVLVGVAVEGLRRLMLGGSVRAGAMGVASAPAAASALTRWVPIAATGFLVIVMALGLPRDPYASAWQRLQPPSLSPWLPFGADASGRDLLARVAHGTVTTAGTALGVALLCLGLGLLIGLAPRLAMGPIEVTNAAPPVIAGLLVAAVWGPSVAGAAVAVAAVSWAPLAAHTSALLQEERAKPYVAMLPVLGVGATRTLLQVLVPAVLPAVFRHAMLRLPGIALALASLGFLGLGPRQPTPEWGLIVSEGIGYLERAPWAVLAPTAALALTSVIAVGLAAERVGAASEPSPSLTRPATTRTGRIHHPA